MDQESVKLEQTPLEIRECLGSALGSFRFCGAMKALTTETEIRRDFHVVVAVWCRMGARGRVGRTTVWCRMGDARVVQNWVSEVGDGRVAQNGCARLDQGTAVWCRVWCTRGRVAGRPCGAESVREAGSGDSCVVQSVVHARQGRRTAVWCRTGARGWIREQLCGAECGAREAGSRNGRVVQNRCAKLGRERPCGAEWAREAGLGDGCVVENGCARQGWGTRAAGSGVSAS